MGTYLNEGRTLYAESVNSEIHVDKSLLIRETNRRVCTQDKYVCLSRPRRFGKSMAAHMLMAYYTRGADSRELFKDKKIYSDPSFEKHFGKYNVIHLRMTDFVAGGIDAMVATLVRFPVAGCFWYQGESNVGRWNYGKMLKAMAHGWRTAWGIDFPVYVCQLSSVNTAGDYLKQNSARARFRDLQRRTVPELGRSGLVVTTDVGAEYEHPRNKIDVGLRCARWALRDVYGRKDLVVSGPLFKGFRREGDKLRVSFDHVGGGLMAADKAPDTPYAAPVPKNTRNVKGFAVYGEDRLWHDAEALIDGIEVVVSAPGVREPKELRYAHMDNAIGRADLYNVEGLPAVGFRTDSQDWKNK